MGPLSRITSNLRLSNQKHASDVKLLLKKKITHVLTVSDQPLDSQTLAYFDEQKITHDFIHFTEREDYTLAQLQSILDSIATKINERQKTHKMVIHCVKGQNRSAAAVLYWMITYKGLSFQDALKTLQQKRHILIDPQWLKKIKRMTRKKK